MATRHVSGSILPSNEPRILRPIETAFGTLQVRVIAELDTHGLFLNGSLLATHGNGYSCHCLAERMVSGNVTWALEQAEYILDCGGTTRHFDHIANAMALDPSPNK